MARIANYALGEAVRLNGIQTYSARHVVLGHEVLVHIFQPGAEPLFRKLVSMAQRLAERERAVILDAGEDNLRPYVVTVRAAALEHFGNWMEQAMTPVAAPPARAAQTPGEFTSAFELDRAPSPGRVPPLLPDEPRPAAAVPRRSDTENFTQWFGAGGATRPETARPPAPAAPYQPPAAAADGSDFSLGGLPSASGPLPASARPQPDIVQSPGALAKPAPSGPSEFTVIIAPDRNPRGWPPAESSTAPAPGTGRSWSMPSVPSLPSLPSMPSGNLPNSLNQGQSAASQALSTAADLKSRAAMPGFLWAALAFLFVVGILFAVMALLNP